MFRLFYTTRLKKTNHWVKFKPQPKICNNDGYNGNAVLDVVVIIGTSTFMYLGLSIFYNAIFPRGYNREEEAEEWYKMYADHNFEEEKKDSEDN